MSVLDYPIGAPFHFEMEMKFSDESDAIGELLNNGEPDMITMDGKVLFNDGTRAIVIIDSRFIEFEEWMLTFDQVCELSPKFREIFGINSSGWQRYEYVCIDVDSGDFVYPEGTR